MKNLKKLLSLLLALVMMVGVFAPLTVLADSQDTTPEETTETVTLHKMLMDKGNLNAKKVTITTGTGDDATEETKTIVLKEGKYYVSTDLDNALDNENDYVKAFNGTTDLGNNKTAVATPVFAGTVGINGTEYDGKQITDLTGFFGAGSKEIKDVYFAVKYKDGPNAGKFVTIKEGTPNEYSSADSLDATLETGYKLLAGLTTANGIKFNTKGLKGEYEIVEVPEKSTYKDDNNQLAASKAVPVVITLPLINGDGVVKDAHVYPKNTEEKPQIDKNFGKKSYDPEENNDLVEVKKGDKDLSTETGTGKNPVVSPTAGADYDNYQKEKARVTAQIGQEVPYEVKTKVNAGSRYQTLNWKDTMTNGLTFLSDSLILKTTPELNLVKNTDYKVTADDRGFTLSLTEAGFEKLNAKTHPEDATGKQTEDGVDVEFTLTYKAKVNSNAVDDIPEKNDIKLEYSNDKKEEIKPTPVTPQNGELKVTKTWSDGTTKDVQVVYTLSNGSKSYAVMLDGNKTTGTVNLGDGITFEITGAYAGTFKGEALKTGTNWTISERVAGYDVTIVEAEVAPGIANITNTKDEKNPEPLNPSEPEVVVGGKKFVKTNQDGSERLAGAQFVVKNGDGKYLALKSGQTVADEVTAYENAETAYNNFIKEFNAIVAKAEADKTEVKYPVTIDSKEYANKKAVEDKLIELKDARDNAFFASRDNYQWITPEAGKTPKEAGALVLTSDDQGRFEISGLAYGTYTLEEITPPEDYAKLSGNEEFLTFKVDKDSYKQAAAGITLTHKGYDSDNDTANYGQQIVNKKVTIPQTGGIGTVIFTVVGIALMAGAVIAMKKNRKEA